MKIKKSWWFYILFVLIVLIQTILFPEVEETAHVDVDEIPKTQLDEAIVIRVIDGDTVELEGGERLRYIGIDTPESTGECYYQEALDRNKQLVEGKVVKLEKDISETDRYDRLLRYIYVDDILINDVLVKEGYATAVKYPPDTKYAELFTASQMVAQDLELGMWGECSAH